MNHDTTKHHFEGLYDKDSVEFLMYSFGILFFAFIGYPVYFFYALPLLMSTLYFIPNFAILQLPVFLFIIILMYKNKNKIIKELKKK